MGELNFPNAVTDERDLFGRSEDLRQIDQTFRSNRRVPVVILGERRTGKTSLMNVAVQRLTEYSNGDNPYVYVPIEPRGITTFESFAGGILSRLATYLWKSWRDMSLESEHYLPEAQTIEQFEVIFQDLLKYGGQETYMICIDEFDEIVRASDQQELSRILGLIHHLTENISLPVKFLLTMTSIPDRIRDQDDSTIVAMAQVLRLAPMREDHFREMVCELSAGVLLWTDAGLRRFMQISGGHPYFTKLILFHLIERCRMEDLPCIVEETALEAAQSMALGDPRTDLVMENLFRVHFSEGERELLLYLAEKGRPVSQQDLFRAGANWLTAARRLVKRAYLQEETGFFNFRMAFLRAWFQSWIAFDEECNRYSGLRKRLDISVDIEVDISGGEVRVLGRPVRLSAQEFDILNCLSTHVGQLVRREELVDVVWKTDQGVSDQVVDTAFYRLRRKIGDQGQYIETVPGQGFKLHRAARLASGPQEPSTGGKVGNR